MYEALQHGVNAHALRLLANGRFVRLEVCKTTDEQRFAQALLMQIQKDECPLKLATLLRTVAADIGKDLTTWEERTAVWNKIAGIVVDKFCETTGTITKGGKETTIAELTAHVKKIEEDNRLLRKGNTPGASSSSAPPQASEVQQVDEIATINRFFDRFARGKSDPTLEWLQLKSVTEKVVQAKIDSLCLPRQKLDKLTAVSDEIIAKLLRKGAKGEQIVVQNRIDELCTSWGLKQTLVANVQGVSEYKVLARLIALATVMEQ